MRRLDRGVGAGVERRRAAWNRGRLAEQAVAEHLRAQGAVLLGRNLRVGRSEVDLLARHGDVILVVEVRHRGAGSFQSGFASLSQEKLHRVRAAGEVLWRTRFASDWRVNRMRFDVASVTFTSEGEPRVEYARGVF